MWLCWVSCTPARDTSTSSPPSADVGLPARDRPEAGSPRPPCAWGARAETSASLGVSTFTLSRSSAGIGGGEGWRSRSPSRPQCSHTRSSRWCPTTVAPVRHRIPTSFGMSSTAARSPPSPRGFPRSAPRCSGADGDGVRAGHAVLDGLACENGLDLATDELDHAHVGQQGVTAAVRADQDAGQAPQRVTGAAWRRVCRCRPPCRGPRSRAGRARGGGGDELLDLSSQRAAQEDYSVSGSSECSSSMPCTWPNSTFRALRRTIVTSVLRPRRRNAIFWDGTRANVNNFLADQREELNGLVGPVL